MSEPDNDTCILALELVDDVLVAGLRIVLVRVFFLAPIFSMLSSSPNDLRDGCMVAVPLLSRMVTGLWNYHNKSVHKVCPQLQIIRITQQTNNVFQKDTSFSFPRMFTVLIFIKQLLIGPKLLRLISDQSETILLRVTEVLS